jgi:HEAT repeat protein
LLVSVRSGAAERGVEDLIGALKSPKAAVRVKAIDQLGFLGKKAAPAVPALARLLKDESEVVRAHAADCLSEIGRVDRQAALAAVPARRSTSFGPGRKSAFP